MSDRADQALAIANLKARYCRAADTAAGDPAAARDLFADVFTDDFVGNFGYDLLHGPSAIIDFMCTAIAGGSTWMIHMLHSPCIVCDGNDATGDWSVMVQSRRISGEDMTIFGRYSDRFRCTPQGWQIARIDFWRPL